MSDLLDRLRGHFLPDCLLIGNATESPSQLISLQNKSANTDSAGADSRGDDNGGDGVRFYVCTSKECLEPTVDVDKVLELLGAAAI